MLGCPSRLPRSRSCSSTRRCGDSPARSPGHATRTPSGSVRRPGPVPGCWHRRSRERSGPERNWDPVRSRAEGSGIAALELLASLALFPREKACKAPSDDVVASEMGVSYFWIVLRDSPMVSRSLASTRQSTRARLLSWVIEPVAWTTARRSDNSRRRDRSHTRFQDRRLSPPETPCCWFEATFTVSRPRSEARSVDDSSVSASC